MGKAPSHKKNFVKIPEWAVEQDKFHIGKKYPYCKGTFPDCPEKIDPNCVASVCKMCPIYRKE